ncbi:MAG: hypothetical protein FWH42_00745 [Dehalococcoidia bacterium]|nr:hypothetical protein [Dehalococcoidia bacterium]
MSNTSKRLIGVLLTAFLGVGLLSFIAPASVPAVAAETPLAPQYGSNGKFIAPIEAPVTGSKPISSRAELEKIGDDASYPLNGVYHLSQNIDLSGGEWVPIGDNSTDSNASRFTGTFDGQGFVISDMTITGSDYQYVGLFGFVDNATIKNVGMENTNITAVINKNNPHGACAGGIAGFAIGSTIANCYNTGDVTANTSGGAWASAGGIVGTAYTNSITITNCYNTGDVTANAPVDSNAYAGGIVGYAFIF